MMKKCKFITILALVLMLSACSLSTRPIDFNNKNITVSTDKKNLSGCDVYYNINRNMELCMSADKKSYSDIVYAASGVARSVWHDGKNKFYTIGEKLTERKFDFLNLYLEDLSVYEDIYSDSLELALNNIKDDRMSVIITDMQSELYDYAKLAELFVKNVLDKKLSIGFIGIQINADDNNAYTFFILAISDAENVSKYISNFKDNPAVAAYSEEKSDYQRDVVGKVNYQIIANQSGIEGIDYEKLDESNNEIFDFVENGYYAGADGNINKKETLGSFTKFKEDYFEKNMVEDIEGTVNFSPFTQRFVTIKNKQGEAVPRYLGIRSLVYKESDSGEEIAGKIKLNVPFNVIDGVKLSKIQCDLDAKVYKSKGASFENEPTKSNIKVEIAEGATPEQGRWRIDNETNSMILNIMVPAANKLPVDKGALKLDISFSQRDTIDSVSEWVKNWDKRGCENLMNFFSSLYSYQKDANTADNSLTVYIAPAKKSETKRIIELGREK